MIFTGTLASAAAWRRDPREYILSVARVVSAASAAIWRYPAAAPAGARRAPVEFRHLPAPRIGNSRLPGTAV